MAQSKLVTDLLSILHELEKGIQGELLFALRNMGYKVAI